MFISVLFLGIALSNNAKAQTYGQEWFPQTAANDPNFQPSVPSDDPNFNPDNAQPGLEPNTFFFGLLKFLFG